MVYDIATLYDWGGWSTLLPELDTVPFNPYYDQLNYLDNAFSDMQKTFLMFQFADSQG